MSVAISLEKQVFMMQCSRCIFLACLVQGTSTGTNYLPRVVSLHTLTDSCCCGGVPVTLNPRQPSLNICTQPSPAWHHTPPTLLILLARGAVRTARRCPLIARLREGKAVVLSATSVPLPDVTVCVRSLVHK